LLEFLFPFLEQIPGHIFHGINPLRYRLSLTRAAFIFSIQTIINFFQITAIKIKPVKL
jgi:hypothetical protein